MKVACRKEDGWLDLRLHYTGHDKRSSKGDSPRKPGITGKDSPSGRSSSDAQLSIEQAIRGNNKKFPPVERPELKLASPFFLKPRLVLDPSTASWERAHCTFRIVLLSAGVLLSDVLRIALADTDPHLQQSAIPACNGSAKLLLLECMSGRSATVQQMASCAVLQLAAGL